MLRKLRPPSTMMTSARESPGMTIAKGAAWIFDEGLRRGVAIAIFGSRRSAKKAAVGESRRRSATLASISV